MSLVSIQNLNIAFKLPKIDGGELQAVRDFNLDISPGEKIGIVGESGAGKSITAFAILNLLKKPGFIKSGRIIFDGRDLASLSSRELDDIRGNTMSMIFQDPMITLNPIMTIGKQLIEILLVHQKISHADAYQKVIQTLEKVKIPSPKERFNNYPHEFSGGMRQRIVIAAAIITEPKLIIADEPTTALDVTIQAEIIELLQELSRTEGMALVLITHDLALVSQIAERILVMYAGRVVEENTTENILKQPHHPYTQGLINCIPQNHKAGQRLYQIQGMMPELRSVTNTCSFYARCEQRKENCKIEVPTLEKSKQGFVRCFYPND